MGFILTLPLFLGWLLVPCHGTTMVVRGSKVCFTRKPGLPVSTNQRFETMASRPPYITLHCIAVHYIWNKFGTLNYMTIHNIRNNGRLSTLHCIAEHCIILHFKQWSVEHIVEAFGRTPLIIDPLSLSTRLCHKSFHCHAAENVMMMILQFDPLQKNV